jgi:spermidine synthase
MAQKPRLILPTLTFALYLMGLSSAGILLVVGCRTFALSAGWTAAAGAAAVIAAALSAAAGVWLLWPNRDRSFPPAAALALAFALFGVAALLSPLLLRWGRAGYLLLWPLAGGTVVGVWVLRLLPALALLALPAAIVTCMPPLLGRLIVARPEAAGLGRGLAFGMSLAGLGLGIALAGSWLLPSLGIGGSFLIGLALAGVAAAGIVLVRQRGVEGDGSIGAALAGEGPSPSLGGPAMTPALQGGRLPIPLGVAVALVGFTVWGYFIIWERALSFIVGGTLTARTLTSGIILLALGVGSILFSGLTDRSERPLVTLGVILAFSSVAAAASMYLMPQVALLYLRLTPLLSRPWMSLLPSICAAAALVLPPCLFLGGALPFLPPAAGGRGRGWAWIVVLTAAGIVLAEIAVGLIMIPAFGLRRSLSIAASIGLLAAILVIGSARLRTPTAGATVTLVLLGLMVGVGGFPATWDPRVVAAGLYRYGARSLARFGSSEEYLAARRGVSLAFYREGANASVIVERLSPGGPGAQQGEALALTIDGRVEATTGQDVRTQVLQAHIPILVHGPTDEVLLVDFLNGVSAGSMLRHPIKKLVVVEKEPAVFEAAASFSAYNQNPLDDARVVRIADTARARLLADPALYDVIVLAGMEPWLPHSASLSTAEGLAVARARLRPGGVLAQRVPLSAMPEPALRACLRAFIRAFDSVLVFKISPDDLLLLGSSEPLSLDVGWFRNVIGSSEELTRDLKRILVLGPNEILHTFRSTGQALRDLLGEGPENGDDRTAVEFASARHLTVHLNQGLLASIENSRTPILPIIKNCGALPEDRARFLYNLAKSFLGIAGDPIRAQDLARELEGLGWPAMARWVRGESLLQQMEVDGALAEWQAVIDVEPDNLDALFSLGTFYLDSRDYKRAETYLARAARLHPDVAAVRYHHGRTLFYLGRHREAIPELKEARRLGGERESYPLVDYLTGVSHYKLGANAAGAGELQAYLKWAYTQQELTRLEVDAHLKLAEIYDRQEKRFEAHQERQKANDLALRLQEYAQQQAASHAGAAGRPEETAAPATAPERP